MTIVDAFRRDEIRVLDRLVDGELGQAERRELLSACDDEPGAWRRLRWPFSRPRPGGKSLGDWPPSRSSCRRATVHGRAR